MLQITEQDRTLDESFPSGQVSHAISSVVELDGNTKIKSINNR